MLKPLLIEIGVEELPAIPFLKELPNIEIKWANLLEKNRLLSDFKFYYTPRRLVLWHREFPTKQQDSFEEFFGAPVEIAYKDEKPTKAFLGFLKKTGAEAEEVGKIERGGKEVLYYKKEIKGEDSTNIIPNIIREFLETLDFGKSMRWGDLDVSFIRPIRWINAFLGYKYLEFELFGVKSSNFSYPHRSISYQPFTFTFAGDYFCKLDKNGVILYQEERKKIILDRFKELEREKEISIEIDEELLNEVVAITENPTPLVGTFNREFLELPPEVIITSMKEHQRYFPVFKGGKITNKFIVVSNAITDDFTQIILGNEKVLKARLSDALFFYRNDLKNGLNNKGLKNIIFMDNLGSLYDKMEREKLFALRLFDLYRERVIKESGESEERLRELLIEAVEVAKADLLTEMVYEFPELQGIIGYYYAILLGKNPLVALAIKEQYLPTGTESQLPSNTFSAIVALAIKIDTLKSLFSIGKIPTGTKDPFGLRRAVIGIIKIVLNFKLEFDFRDILNSFSTEYREFDFAPLEEFILERVYKYFDANESIIKAVILTDERDFVKIEAKINALKSVVNSSEFREISSTFKRVANIIKDLTKVSEVREELFQKEEEKILFKRYREVIEKEYSTYEEKLDALFGLKPEIDTFFDNVMVNDKNEEIKNNRKNLIANIYNGFKTIGDIKEITI